MGFFSNCDIADEIEVKTKKSGSSTTNLTMNKSEEDWQIEYHLSEEHFKGTEVTMQLPQHVSENKIFRTLAKNLGFMPSDFVVYLNGEKLNCLKDMYEEIATTEIEGADLTLNFAKKELRNNEFFDRAYHPGNLIMTQNGLYVKNPGISEVADDESLASLVDRMTDLGYNFWIELPNNVGLTKGRNNIVSGDVDKVSRASTEAFSYGFLERILEDDELCEKLDNQIGVIVSRALENLSYKPTWRHVWDGICGLYHNLKETEIYLSDIKLFMQMKNSSEHFSSEKRLKSKYPAAYDFRNLAGFSGALLNKEIVPAVIYEDNTAFETKISVKDLVDGFYDGTLITKIPTNLNDEKMIYVDKNRWIVNRVISQLNQKSESKLDVWSDSKTGVIGVGASIASSIVAFGYSFKRVFETYVNYDFGRTKRENFEGMLKKYGKGQEYLTLFDNLEYIDKVISESNQLDKAKIRLFGRSSSFSETAHTNLFSMGFNIYDRTIRGYLHSIRNGGYDESNLRSLVELVIHEKSHDVLGLFNAVGDHGAHFYYTKKEMRETFYEYCKNKSIDPYQEINSQLEPLEKSLTTEEVKKHLF